MNEVSDHKTIPMALRTLLLLFTVACSTTYSQQLLVAEMVLELETIDDLSIDTQNRFIILEHDLIRVYRDGTLEQSIILPAERTTGYIREFSSRKLAVDAQDNIYCLTLSLEAYVSIMKFDGFGQVITPILRGDSLPKRSERIIDFTVSRDGRVYLNTFPHGGTRAGENPVYAYDSDGHFLGKVDYFIEDRDGNVYRIDRSLSDIDIFSKFERGERARLNRTKDLAKVASVRFPKAPGVVQGHLGIHWSFVGVDTMRNIYLTDGLEVQVFNHQLGLLKRYRIPIRHLEEQIVIVHIRKMRIGPDGSIYVFGRKRSGQQVSAPSDTRGRSVLLRMRTR